MFSATFRPEIQKMAKEFLHEYIWISVGRAGSTVDNIRQKVLKTTADPAKKMELLYQSLTAKSGRTLVFVQKRKTASWVCTLLRKQYGITADEIHSDRSQVTT
jgi:ATP-dependent RNA helicase DDX3X